MKKLSILILILTIIFINTIDISYYKMDNSVGVTPDGQVIEINERYSNYTHMIDILLDKSVDDGWITLLFNSNEFEIIDNR